MASIAGIAAASNSGKASELAVQEVAVSSTAGAAVTTGTAINVNHVDTGTALLPPAASSSQNSYHVVAYKPHNPQNVRVAVSISKQQVYVMEGDRCLMAAACCVGVPEKPTPRGHFTIAEKIPNKRSGAYGFQVSNGVVTPCEARTCRGTYIGYPMPFWCEFAPPYGFYQGYVWPAPHTHGVIRLDNQVAPRFFELVQIGTPVDIADTQPEDLAYGQNVRRPDDYRDPDSPPAFMISTKPFEKPAGTLLIEQ